MHKDVYRVVRPPSCLTILIKNMSILRQNLPKLLQDRKSPHVKRRRGQKKCDAYAVLVRASTYLRLQTSAATFAPRATLLKTS